MKNILFPLLKVVSVALLIGLIFALIGKTIGFGIAGFLIGMIIQFLVGWIIGSYRDIMFQKFAFEQRLDEERILEANSVTVNCAACNTEHFIPILIKERNTFACRKCKVENAIILGIQTARTTEPIDVIKQDKEAV